MAGRRRAIRLCVVQGPTTFGTRSYCVRACGRRDRAPRFAVGTNSTGMDGPDSTSSRANLPGTRRQDDAETSGALRTRRPDPSAPPRVPGPTRVPDVRLSLLEVQSSCPSHPEAERRSIVRLNAGKIAILLLMVAPAARAQLWSGPAAVEVRVQDPKGGPVSGARVQLQLTTIDPKDGPPAVETDAHGQANVGGLAEGAWIVEVSHEGFMTYVAQINVHEGDRPTVIMATQIKVPGAQRTLEVALARGRRSPSPAKPPVVVEAPAPPPQPRGASRSRSRPRRRYHGRTWRRESGPSLPWRRLRRQPQPCLRPTRCICGRPRTGPATSVHRARRPSRPSTSCLPAAVRVAAETSPRS
jgi:carboxypeptidase family protein